MVFYHSHRFRWVPMVFGRQCLHNHLQLEVVVVVVAYHLMVVEEEVVVVAWYHLAVVEEEHHRHS
jgi:hypothetical protein